MAWWRARVVAPARRAWLAVVAARVRRRKGRTGKQPFSSRARQPPPPPLSLG